MAGITGDMSYRCGRPALAAIAAAILLAAGGAGASCAPHAVQAPEGVRLAGESLLIVTHPTSTHDARYSSKHGVDDAVEFAKAQKIPVVYLQDDTSDTHYFPDDCEPTHWIRSQDGEVRFKFSASNVLLAGGHLELCLAVTAHEVLDRWAKKPVRDRTMTYLMDAIYSNGKMVEPGDPYYGDFHRFLGIVTYGRPGGETWPKLNLLETMGVIVKDEDEYAYLRKVMPNWQRAVPPVYRVELQLNDGAKRLLRPGTGTRPPTMLFRFVDSASHLVESPFTDRTP
ncbi:MAG: hypothetical protein U1F51_18410 [Burkholderiales bacterium]